MSETDEAKALLETIATAGLAVRDAKASGADNAKDLVGKLLALKGEYKTLTGEDVPGSKPKKEKKKKKDAAPKEAKKPKPSNKKVTEPRPGAKTVTAKEAKAQEPQIVQPPTTTGPLQINVVDGSPAWEIAAINVAIALSKLSVSVVIDKEAVRAAHPSSSVLLAIGGENIWGVEAIVGYVLEKGGGADPAAPTNQHWLGWYQRNIDGGTDVATFEKAASGTLKKTQFLTGSELNSADVVLGAWAAVSGSTKLKDWVKRVVANVSVAAAPTATSSGSVPAKAPKKAAPPKVRKAWGPRPSHGSSFYVTTAINYTNGNPHVGHAYEAVTTDVIARYHRSYGRDVFYMTGTDEHGKKIAETAAGKSPPVKPIDICNEYANKFQALNKRLDISNDLFIRTTMDAHKKSAQELWKICEQKGDIYLDIYEGWYDIKEEAFVTDTTAEEMGFKDSAGKPLEKMKEESYFFRMSKYETALRAHIKANPKCIQPDKRRQDVMMRLDECSPLKDLSVSRSTFEWGVPVPGNPKHVMYVWFDALSNYLSGIGALTGGDKAKMWPANLHVVGKDITWFHCVIWPCMLLSAGIPLAERVYGHGFVQDKNGQKMSKAIGNVVDPNDILDRFSSDLVRYFMIKQAPYGSDLKFSESDMILMNNSDLADTLGNLAHRATNLTKKYCGGVVPDVKSEGDPVDFEELIHIAEAHMANQELQQTVAAVMACLRQLNEYFTVKEPWKIKGKTAADDIMRQSIVRTVLEGLYVLAHFLLPVIPAGASKVFEKLGTPASKIATLSAKYDNLKPGTACAIGEILFAKIELEGAAPASAGAAAAPAPSSAKAAVGSPEALKALEAVTAAGEAVRVAKSGGKGDAKDLIPKLLAAKADYKALTGEDVPGTKKKKKK